MKIVTSAEMREIDRLTTEKYGIPSLTLMENAGDAVARFILGHLSGENQRITVVCGKGNNGGDGFVAARKLHEQGKDVVVLLLARAEEVKGDARRSLESLPFPPVSVTSSAELDTRETLLSNTDVIVDAVFGTGFRPPLPQLAAKAVQLIGKSSARVVSVDLPSGIDADSFDVEQAGACRSDAIVTFTAPKPAVIFGTLTRGPITVYSIGSPPDIIQSKLGLEWNSPPSILKEKRRLNSHKGLYGHALVIGGSLGKSGAPTMASTAALRIGAGLVTCAVPKSIQPIVAGYTPEIMTEALDENASGHLSAESLADPVANQLLERKNVVALGPGLGGDPDTVKSIRGFVAKCPLPLVIDADGLNAFAVSTVRGSERVETSSPSSNPFPTGNGTDADRELLNGSKRPLVLTPHPGEMARLTGKKTSHVESNRIEIARSFAREHHVVLVLKGWRTLIATPDGNIWVNTTGNPGLAKGGSGDVLTGMIAGLIAQFPDSIVEAVRAAVYLHGFAADLTLQNQDMQTMLATDIFASFPPALRRLATAEAGFVWIQQSMTPSLIVNA